MRPWIDPQNRGGAGQWGVAFPTALIRVLSQYLNEFFEPVMTLLLDIMTAFILGFFFVIQSLTVLISFDTIVVAIINAIHGILYKMLSVVMNVFTFSDQDKRVIGFAAIDFASNILWAEMVCHNMSETVRSQYFFMPCLAFSSVHMSLSLMTKKMETDTNNLLYQRLLLVQMIVQSLMLVYRVSHTPKEDVPTILFLLKANIDIFIQSAGALSKVWARSSTINNNTVNDSTTSTNLNNHSLSTSTSGTDFTPTATQILEGKDPLETAYYLEIFRQFFWLLLTINQFMSLKSLRRQDVWFFYSIIFHNLLTLFIQLREVNKREQVRRMMARRFKRITPEELVSLREENCAVCLNEHNHESMRIPCNHVFHAQCLTRTLQATPRGQNSRCPICRADIHTYSATTGTASASTADTHANANANGNGAVRQAYSTRASGLGLRHRVVSALSADQTPSAAASSSSSSAAAAADGAPSALLSIRIIRPAQATSSTPSFISSSSVLTSPVLAEQTSHTASASNHSNNLASLSTSLSSASLSTARTIREALAQTAQRLHSDMSQRISESNSGNTANMAQTNAGYSNGGLQSSGADSTMRTAPLSAHVDTRMDTDIVDDNDHNNNDFTNDYTNDYNHDISVEDAEEQASNASDMEQLDSLLHLIAQSLEDEEEEEVEDISSNSGSSSGSDRDDANDRTDSQPRPPARIDTALMSFEVTEDEQEAMNGSAQSLAGRKRKRRYSVEPPQPQPQTQRNTVSSASSSSSASTADKETDNIRSNKKRSRYV